MDSKTGRFVSSWPIRTSTIINIAALSKKLYQTQLNTDMTFSIFSSSFFLQFSLFWGYQNNLGPFSCL